MKICKADSRPTHLTTCQTCAEQPRYVDRLQRNVQNETRTRQLYNETCRVFIVHVSVY